MKYEWANYILFLVSVEEFTMGSENLKGNSFCLAKKRWESVRISSSLFSLNSVSHLKIHLKNMLNSERKENLQKHLQNLSNTEVNNEAYIKKRHKCLLSVQLAICIL